MENNIDELKEIIKSVIKEMKKKKNKKKNPVGVEYFNKDEIEQLKIENKRLKDFIDSNRTIIKNTGDSGAGCSN